MSAEYAALTPEELQRLKGIGEAATELHQQSLETFPSHSRRAAHQRATVREPKAKKRTTVRNDDLLDLHQCILAGRSCPIPASWSGQLRLRDDIQSIADSKQQVQISMEKTIQELTSSLRSSHAGTVDEDKALREEVAKAASVDGSALVQTEPILQNEGVKWLALPKQDKTLSLAFSAVLCQNLPEMKSETPSVYFIPSSFSRCMGKKGIQRKGLQPNIQIPYCKPLLPFQSIIPQISVCFFLH